MKQELAIRRYSLGGELIRVNKYDNMGIARIKAFVAALFRMDKRFGSESTAPLNPCNISVRGPKGRFTKWKN